VLFLHRQHAERSMNQYADARARNLWFDPSWRGKRSAPQCRMLREYARAAIESPVSPGERARTLLPLARWTIRRRTVLTREIATYLFRRKASRTSASSDGINPAMTRRLESEAASDA